MLDAVWGAGWVHWGVAGVVVCLWGSVGVLWQQRRVHAGLRRWELRLREEMEGYARLEVRLPGNGDVRPLGHLVCAAVAQWSVFDQVAMLAVDAEGRMVVAGCVGMEDAGLEALRSWAEARRKEDGTRRAGAMGGLERPMGGKSLVVKMGAGLGRAVVVPLWTTAGRMLGALAVSGEAMHRRRVEEAIPPLETLAMKVARTMENAALAERLMRAEKLAGLGQLAGGVAHALNNPLTAVLGYAELIAEMTSEARVQEGARTIAHEARRMRDTVESLLTFWRPVTLGDEPVEITTMLFEVAEACSGKLDERGVRMVMQVGDGIPAVRGNKGRLRQVMEHLLNNAAQSIAGAAPRPYDKAHAIRIVASFDAEKLHLIVSDTGPGFKEPGRVFDPFYTTREPGEGVGLGLSICYGIVREHGGEIAAFNLHPCGAAVVVDLPLRQGDRVQGTGLRA